jgi:hypothetical protein
MPNHNQFKRKWEPGDRAGQCSGACSGSIAAEKRATEGFVTRQLRQIAQIVLALNQELLFLRKTENQ